MPSFLPLFRDKARNSLHQLARWLGETAGIKPESLYNRQQGNASLALDLPSFQSLLPYQCMNEELLFINQESVGFGLMLSPSSGADESLMKSLATLFKTKLPKEAQCTVLLYKHPYLAEALEQSYGPILQEDSVDSALAQLNLDFHKAAIQKGYANNRNIPAQLADYIAYCFVSLPKQGAWEGSLLALRGAWESELKVAGFAQTRLTKIGFRRLLQTLTSPNLATTNWPSLEEDQGLLSQGIAHPSTLFEISERHLDISLVDEANVLQKTRLINCQISHWPAWDEPFGLWQSPDLFASLLRPEQGISCPFLLSFTICGISKEALKRKTKTRTKDANANNNAIQNYLNPSLAEEAYEWNLVHKAISKGELDLLPTFYNLILFTSPSQEQEQVAQAISSYRQLGFELSQRRGSQWLAYLGSLPFLGQEGLFEKLRLLGLTKRLSHYNVANLLPVIADFKGSRQGLLLPTYRHQLFFYDPFDDKNLPISNYNRLTVASTGAGKSYFQQALLLDGLSRGHQIFVIDIGESYKHLCELVGGNYIDATTIALNPFTLFDFEGSVELNGQEVNNTIQLRDLLAIMASPEGRLDEVQKDWLLEALIKTLRLKGCKALMDDFLEALQNLLDQEEMGSDRRLKDLVVLLSKYGSKGLYGYLCNGVTPLFSGSRFTVIELGGFESNPELLSIVMYLMIIIIQGQFYSSDRRLYKQCNFDEVWRALTACANPIAANFLNHGFRTARKYNAGFSAVTQSLLDTEATPQGQAIAHCSDTKIILRQGNFKEYLEKHPKRFSPLQQEVLQGFGEAKMQGFSNVMLQFGTVSTFHRFFTPPFLKVLFSTSGDEFGAVEALRAKGVSLGEAVQEVASRYYGEGA